MKATARTWSPAGPPSSNGLASTRKARPQKAQSTKGQQLERRHNRRTQITSEKVTKEQCNEVDRTNISFGIRSSSAANEEIPRALAGGQTHVQASGEVHDIRPTRLPSRDRSGGHRPCHTERRDGGAGFPVPRTEDGGRDFEDTRRGCHLGSRAADK